MVLKLFMLESFYVFKLLGSKSNQCFNNKKCYPTISPSLAWIQFITNTAKKVIAWTFLIVSKVSNISIFTIVTLQMKHWKWFGVIHKPRSWTLLSNKVYVIKWSFGWPRPPQQSTWFMDDPFSKKTCKMEILPILYN